MPKFSIIIPTYEHTELLERALQSVITQNLVDWEVIISDDSISNDVKDYVESLRDERISYLKHNKGVTAAENWNFGMQAAKGDYMILMHHDEAFTVSTQLQCIAQAFETGVQVVVSNIEIEKDGKTSKGRPRWLKKLALRNPSLLLLCNAIGPTACMAFRQERKQPFNSQLSWLVDAEWYYRMLKGATTLFLENISIRSYHGHQGQLSLEMNALEAFKHDQATINKTHSSEPCVRYMTILYGCLIMRTKKIFCKI